MGQNKFVPDFDAFQFFEDGTEAGASSAAAENVDVTGRSVDSNAKIQIRVRIQETGAGSISGATTDDYQLQVDKNAADSYINITASSADCQADTGSALTDGAVSTQRLSNGSGSFIAGEQESADAEIEDHELTADNFTEHVFGLNLISADLVDGDFLEFKLLLNGGNMSNSVLPRITVTKSAGGDVTRTPDPDLLVLDEKLPLRIVNYITLPLKSTTSLTLDQKVPVRVINHVAQPPVAAASLVLDEKLPLRIVDHLTLPLKSTTSLTLDEKLPLRIVDHIISVSRLELNLVTFIGLQLFGYPPIAVTGEADNVTRTPDPDLLVLDEKIPVAIVNHVAQPAAAATSLVLGEQTPLRIVNHITTPAERDLVFDEKTPLRIVDHLTTPAERDLVFDEKIPTALHAFNVEPAERALVLDEKIPTIQHTLSAEPPERDLVLNGKIPIARVTILVAPDERDLVLSGKIPIVLHTLSAEPDERALVFDEKVPTILHSLSAEPDERDLVLSGKIPIVRITILTIPAERDLLLDGKVPLVLHTLSAEPAERDLVLSGKVPQAIVNFIATPAERDLVLDEKTPQAVVDFIATPAERNLILSGKIPTIPAVGDVIEVPAYEVRLTTFKGLQLFGYPPVVFSPIAATPPAGALILASTAAITDPVIQIGAASLAITTVNPNSLPGTNWVIPVDEATLAFTELVPTRGIGLLLSGYAPNLVYEDIVPLTGSLSLTGQLPEIVDTSPQDIVVEPPPRISAYTGKALTLNRGQETELSSLIVSGWPPVSVVENPVFFPTAGALTFTPNAPELSIEKFIAEGLLLLTGKAPTVQVSNNSLPAPNKGTLLFAGQVPDVFGNTTLIQPLAGAALFVGGAVFIGRSINPAAVARNISGQAPTIDNTDLNKLVEPPVLTLGITGQQPQSLGNTGLVPLVGALSITEQVPTAEHETDALKIPSERTLALAAYAPKIFIATIKYPAAAVLTLNGQIVGLKTVRIKIAGARTQLVKLTTRNTLYMLYD